MDRPIKILYKYHRRNLTQTYFSSSLPKNGALRGCESHFKGLSVGRFDFERVHQVPLSLSLDIGLQRLWSRISTLCSTTGKVWLLEFCSTDSVHLSIWICIQTEDSQTKVQQGLPIPRINMLLSDNLTICHALYSYGRIANRCKRPSLFSR